MWLCGYVANLKLFLSLGPFWDHFGVILKPFWDPFGPLWDHFKTTLAPFWNHFEIILGPLWDNFETTLGSFWNHFGIIFGPIFEIVCTDRALPTFPYSPRGPKWLFKNSKASPCPQKNRPCTCLGTSQTSRPIPTVPKTPTPCSSPRGRLGGGGRLLFPINASRWIS